nr:diacylglycerol kinase family protein [Carnobacterium gallinarum]
MDLNDKKDAQDKKAFEERDERCEKNKNFLESFYHAVDGIVTAYKEEANLKVHLFIGVLVIFVSWFFKLSKYEWLWMILVIFLVIVMEIWNTVIENLVDLAADGKFHPLAKKAKDMAAAAVLITASFALVVGAIIFLPKLYYLFF